MNEENDLVQSILPDDLTELKKRISLAIEKITQHGMTDGAHHKQWVLDQVLRVLLQSDYAEFINEQNDPEYDPWDEGCVP